MVQAMAPVRVILAVQLQGLCLQEQTFPAVESVPDDQGFDEELKKRQKLG